MPDSPARAPEFLEQAEQLADLATTLFSATVDADTDDEGGALGDEGLLAVTLILEDASRLSRDVLLGVLRALRGCAACTPPEAPPQPPEAGAPPPAGEAPAARRVRVPRALDRALRAMQHAPFQAVLAHYDLFSAPLLHEQERIVTVDLCYIVRWTSITAERALARHRAHGPQRARRARPDAERRAGRLRRERRREPPESLAATDLPLVRAARVVLSRAPILEYSVSELMSALRQLEASWKRLHYSSELQLYVERLEQRCAAILCAAHSAAVHDVPLYRRPLLPPAAQGAGSAAKRERRQRRRLARLLEADGAADGGATRVLYVCDDRFVEHAASLLVRMWLAVCQRSMLRHEPFRSEVQLAPELSVGGLLKWLTTLTLNEEMLGFRDRIRSMYMAMARRMTEAERFQREVSRFRYTAGRAITKYRGGAAFRGLVDAIDRPCAELLRQAEERDPLLTFCVAHVLICHYMSARWQVHWPNYVVTEREQLARNADLVGATGPLLVQTFNAFNVHLPSGRVIETRSYLTAFLVWLTILERQHACVLERVDLRATYDIVTHFSRRHAAEQTQMGGTDAVDAGMSGSECESDADAGDSDCGLPGFDLV